MPWCWEWEVGEGRPPEVGVLCTGFGDLKKRDDGWIGFTTDEALITRRDGIGIGCYCKMS